MKLIVSNNWFHTETHVADDAAWPIMLSVFFAMNGKANKMHLSYHLHTQYISSNLLVSFQTACGKCIFSRAWRCITRATTQVMHRKLMRANATVVAAKKIWTSSSSELQLQASLVPNLTLLG